MQQRYVCVQIHFCQLHRKGGSGRSASLTPKEQSRKLDECPQNAKMSVKPFVLLLLIVESGASRSHFINE